MKVCTDACLFGAFVAGCKTCLTFANTAMLPPGKAAANCLDIGSGTGLLSLMVAQKNDWVEIDVIEIDPAAAKQLSENIAATPWADKIQVFNEDILSFVPDPQDAARKKYDCIFSNPPFFEKNLQSYDNAKNSAKHDTALSLLQLVKVVDKLLTPAGFFAVLLPYHRVEYFIDECKKSGLHLDKKILVKQTVKHKFFRGILFFTRRQTTPQNTDIIIRDAENNYTPAFAAALQDYYLFL